jgi:hypothetical protein
MSSSQLGERFRHTGFAVASIAAVLETFCKAVGGSNWLEAWRNPLPRVRAAFIDPSRPGDPSVDLVERSGPGSPAEKAPERGGAPHHVRYEVDNLQEAARRAALRPRPAVALGGRRIWREELHRVPRKGSGVHMRTGFAIL